MERIVTGINKPKEQIEAEKTEIKSLVDILFKRASELGVKIDVPCMGHHILDPDFFAYFHKDEIWYLNYKVQL